MLVSASACNPSSITRLCVCLQITGTLPSWGNFSSLEMLDLSDNYLSGYLPEDWPLLSPEIAEIYLGFNYLSVECCCAPQMPCTDPYFLLLYVLQVQGFLPDWDQGMAGLSVLSLPNNSVSGAGQNIALPAHDSCCQSAHLRLCSGSIPSAWSQALPALTQLIVYNNSLQGTIPSWPSRCATCLTHKSTSSVQTFHSHVSPL